LHNQEASIIVGESRPFPSSTIQDVTTAGSTAVRSSVEYKDIAIELIVTPRINPEGYVTMDINQKINDVGENVDLGGGQLVASITKREAKSAVTVKDQSTIVLGGLIRENKRNTETKVPFLGDIPLLGTLFRGKVTDKQRTELIVFIRPTVLRNAAAAIEEARRRARMLKAGEELELGERLRSPVPEAPNPGPTGDTKTKQHETSTAEPVGRHDAKIKALQEQEMGQPDRTPGGGEMN
jgi:general secretion pathway protein D